MPLSVGVGGDGLAVDVDRDRRVRAAELTDALPVERDAPLDEELAQRVVDVDRRLGVEDAVRLVGVERRDARLLAGSGDPAVGLAGPGLDRGVVDPDPDAAGHDLADPVDEDVEVGVDVVLERLLGVGHEPGGDGPRHRVRRSRPTLLGCTAGTVSCRTSTRRWTTTSTRRRGRGRREQEHDPSGHAEKCTAAPGPSTGWPSG